MKLPKFTSAMGLVALVGVATSVQASNLVLSPGDLDKTMPSASGITPAGSAIDFLYAGPKNQGGFLNPGLFTGYLESAVTQWSGQKLAFWYKVTNVDRSRQGLQSNPLTFMGVYLPVLPGTLEVNQEAPPTASQLSSDKVSYDLAGRVGFQYTINQIPAAFQSSWVVIYTDYTDYKVGDVRVTGGGDLDFPALVPIPEPGTYAGLFALGLAGFAAYRRFRA